MSLFEYTYVYQVFFQNIMQAVSVFNPLLLVPELNTNVPTVLIFITGMH
jgi:hypothetical protein